ncbi:MAG TPA: hypothetical protein VK473_03650 [Terriglobales bacterium]|nr:hypothetical protein [Terriglobales bacterium]
MNLLDHSTGAFGRYQPMANENSANNEYAILGFYFSTHFTPQSSVTGFDLPRCQRGGKRAL